MKVVFANNRLRGCYGQHPQAVCAWWPAVARKNVQRIDTILAADTFTELYAIRCFRLHPLKENMEGLYAIYLADR